MWSRAGDLLTRVPPEGGIVESRDGLRTDWARITLEESAEWGSRSESFARRLPDRRSDFFPIPGTKPYIRELVVDIDGRLWVSRYTEPEFVPYTDAQLADRMRRNLPNFQWRIGFAGTSSALRIAMSGL